MNNQAAIALLGGLLLVSTSPHGDIVIYSDNLIDGKADRLLGAHTVRVSGNEIVAVEPGRQPAGNDDTVYDLAGHTLLPGLMDMHTHLSSEYTKDSYIERFRLNEADYTIRAVDNANSTLQAGFTTVRDLGDRYNATAALRNAIRAGRIPGPRIHTALKSIATTGGHADPTNGWAKRLGGTVVGPLQGVVNGPDQGRAAVRQRYKDGADLIKITATGGVLSVAKSGRNPQFTEAEIRAIVETAKDYGFHVAAHAHGKRGMLRAVNAGVKSIEHGTYMDDEVMKAMKRNGTYYVPTITAGRWVAEKAKQADFFPALVRPKAAAIGPQIQDTFAAAYRAGVTIVFGTDTGVSPHGENAQEFVYMVEAGMPAMEAIKSATSVAAHFLDVGGQLGTVESGKLADLIAVPGDPLDDISRLGQVSWVMKDGGVYKSP